ncbi:MAG TPA: DUF3038 domain-containing protein [Stenomitos sp.]
MDPPIDTIASPSLTDTRQWGTPAIQPNGAQLDNIKTQIDLILLALEAIAGIGSEAMLQAATELGVQEMISDRVALWRLRQSNPMRRGSGGRKKLDIEEARSLVLISCHLAQAHHSTIRRAISLLEDLTEQNRPPHQAALLGDYLDQFTNLYQERMDDEHRTPEALTDLGLKLLIDLLFYSGPQGVRRLWMALLDRTQIAPHGSS